MEKSLSSQKNRIAQMLFYIAFVMEILIMCLNSAGVNIPYRSRLLQLAAVIFGIKIILTHYSKKEWLAFIGLCVLGLVQFFTVHSTLILEIILMIAASKDIDWEMAIKVYFGIMFTSMVLMILLSTTGIIGNLSLTKDYRGNGLETRYCFGYSHPNVFYSNLLKMVLACLLVCYRKLTGWHYLAFTIVNVVLYLLADSRTGFLVVELAIVAFYCYYKQPDFWNHKWVRYCGQSIIAIVILLSYLLPCIPYEKIQVLDHLLTGRINCAIVWKLGNNLSLLPNNLGEGYVLDMGYFNLMVNWGILIGVVYLAIIFYNYQLFYKNKNWAKVLVLIVYSIFTFVEAHAFSVYFVGNTMFLLMLGWGTYESNEPKKQSA